MNWRMMFAVATLVALYGFLGASNWHPVAAVETHCAAPDLLPNNRETVP